MEHYCLKGYNRVNGFSYFYNWRRGVWHYDFTTSCLSNNLDYKYAVEKLDYFYAHREPDESFCLMKINFEVNFMGGNPAICDLED